MNSDTIDKLVLSMENLNSFSYETYIDCQMEPFENKFYFTNVTVTQIKVESANLRREFYHNRMILFFNRLSLEIRGYVGATSDTAHVGFPHSMIFKNISIHVIAESLQRFSTDEFYPYIDFIHYEDYESHLVAPPWYHEDLPFHLIDDVYSRIEDHLPSLFEFGLRNNNNFTQTLQATLSRCPEKETITSFYSLDIFRTKSYYFIPHIKSLGRTLGNISITGMHNFHSHSIAKNRSRTVSTLAIKYIQGTADLHYIGGNFTIFPLYFEVDCISITVDQKQQRITATAHNYTVIETKTNVPLTEYQSKWVMEGIQVAIASSIMPSMKHYRNSNYSTNTLEEHPIVKISTKLSQQFKGSTIQKLYDAWSITIPESFNTESTIEIESNIYNISIEAKPKTDLKPYPDRILCNLYRNLQIHFKTSTWLGKISVFNSTHEFDDIGFLMGKVFVELVKQNNSNEFELKSFSTLDVKLFPTQYNFTDHDRLEIAQKTQQLMISLIKKTVILFAEPLLSLPLDHCTSPVKMFDDFLPFYADHELPFRVPVSRIANESLLSNITNLIITDWRKSPTACVSINQEDLVNGSMVISTYVNLQLGLIELLMNCDNDFIPLDELHLWTPSVYVRNYTDRGEIEVDIVSYPRCTDRYIGQWDELEFLPTSNLVWIREKLEYILGECFNHLISVGS
ncbi:uncharacterized protein LOC135837329 [Planococcus citri]|uniref:uncharacterized protein LOC135837329 n=1 Tax=Planococcus citri TaxID=170843 RepID=UPI0031F9ED8B